MLSAVDLAMTLGFMSTIGMFEDNPLVRWIAAATGLWGIVALKFASVSVCAAALYRVRNHWKGEVGAWLCVAILVAVCGIWIEYSILQIAHEIVVESAEGFVRL